MCSTPVRSLLILVCLSASATTHLWLAATPLSLPGAGTITNILCLIVLHVNIISEQFIMDLTRYRVS